MLLEREGEKSVAQGGVALDGVILKEPSMDHLQRLLQIDVSMAREQKQKLTMVGVILQLTILCQKT
jgi:hypothetical protein